MQPLRQFAPALIADVVRRQPPSPARTTFAWQVVVGPALARTANVELVQGTLYVRATDARWATELHRAEPAVLERMQRLLGPDQNPPDQDLCAGRRVAGANERGPRSAIRGPGSRNQLKPAPIRKPSTGRAGRYERILLVPIHSWGTPPNSP